MVLKFNIIKTTQAAAYLLHKLKGSEKYIKIIKLLYLADRAAINQQGLPITGDTYVSMDKGPVTSITLDLIHYGPPPGQASYWHNYISSPHSYQIKLLENPGIGYLSINEIEILDEIIAEFGSWDEWALVDYTHKLPEYRDPHGSSLPISYEDIMNGLNKNDEEKRQIQEQIEFAAGIEALFGVSRKEM